VLQIMELVELESLAQAIVGKPGLSGLSVEQRKRLTIAVELVANPSIIFMVSICCVHLSYWLLALPRWHEALGLRQHWRMMLARKTAASSRGWISSSAAASAQAA
jgi:hypothetical protein